MPEREQGELACIHPVVIGFLGRILKDLQRIDRGHGSATEKLKARDAKSIDASHHAFDCLCCRVILNAND
jgi:hypothetical protein